MFLYQLSVERVFFTFGFIYVFLALLILYLRVRFSDDPWVKRRLKKYLILRNLDDIYKPFLAQNFVFYNSLNAKDRLLFEKRVQKFIDIKQFIARGVREVTPEMKAMIAGCAVQLTFGYPEVFFNHFWRILIYSDSYYSTITHKYHKGEVNIGGIIVLSWKSFKEGFANPTDGRNLGLHEMAHALRLINIVDNDEYDFYDREIMKEFENEAHNEISKLRRTPEEASMFRNYFVTNMDEFFSICVECFFERPADLRNQNPRLNDLLRKILKIDPIIIYSSSEPGSMAS